MTSIGSSTDGVSRAADNSGLGQCAGGSDPVQRAPPTMTPMNRTSTSRMRCFGCSEIVHR